MIVGAAPRELEATLRTPPIALGSLTRQSQLQEQPSGLQPKPGSWRDSLLARFKSPRSCASRALLV